jgi:crotonobetainyl-CoA:carnitine CoA-transferase CaiB-like acyl-CoA transferase
VTAATPGPGNSGPGGAPGPLLEGVRILDLTDGRGEMCGRYLADLGAMVILVEPPGGAASRAAQPMHEGVSLYFATRNANKRAVALELADAAGRERFLSLVDTVDIVIESGQPGEMAALGLGAAELRQRRPSLVVVSITDFGQDGPYAGFEATDLTIAALTATLDRSGNPGREPIPPPGRLVTEAATIQAAWAALLAYANAAATGIGDHVDASLMELSISAFDPGFGVAGSARSTLPTDVEVPRGRPDSSRLYPIVQCADGLVRFCLLAPRQWQGMWRMIGEPEEFADRRYDHILNRFADWDTLLPRIAEAFRHRTRTELVETAKAERVPLTDVLTLGESMAAEHFTARGSFAELEVAPGTVGKIANGFLVVDGQRAGIRTPAPAPGEGDEELLQDPGAPASAPLHPPLTADPARPLAGLRVLDLGVIVMGAELPRLFADMGADVVKVENRAFPDGMRAVGPGEVMTQSFVWGHRNKRSLGLDLRRPEGAELFRRLAAEADIVMSNFKPGTMHSLGLGREALHAVNPRLVVAESSALGSTGPWSDRMGYGPLIRASTALSAQWRYPGEDGGFCDTNTVYPDHAAARVEAVAVLAAVLRARRTGVGAFIEAAQAETILSQLSDSYLLESLVPGSAVARGNTSPYDAPFGAYPCDGDDEWCAIEVRGDAEWRALTAVLGRPELAEDARFRTAADRVSHRDEVDALIREWTLERSPLKAMRLLQDARVPAGAMARVPELLDDPHLIARGFWRDIYQPHRDEIQPTENGPARFRVIAEPAMGPAPLHGEHSGEVLSQWLGMDEREIARLCADGVVETPDPALI